MGQIHMVVVDDVVEDAEVKGDLRVLDELNLRGRERDGANDKYKKANE